MSARAEPIVVLDGVPLDLAGARIGAWHHVAEIRSTMDLAHQLAADGAPDGTVVCADVQSAGRGRGGKVWVSRAGDGLWCTLLARAVGADALPVLSLRVGLALAQGLAPWCDGTPLLKWPNDVLLDAESLTPNDTPQRGKLAGVLVEARWRAAMLEWVAIGIGVNLRRPGDVPADVCPATLRAGTTRADVLSTIIPRVRTAAQARGLLTASERAQWAAQDAVAGRRCVSPAEGIVQGIDADGALRVATVRGELRCRTGSLELAPTACERSR